MAAIRFRVRSLLLLVPAVAVSIVVYIRWVDARQVLDLTGNMAHPKKSATQQRKKMPRISEGLLDIRVSLLW
ncbi:MAG: hypothetical protein L0228_09140, partial [Planctomycetes bacterium]|nr:hypothetical protein [Planctomycetota bacterium]